MIYSIIMIEDSNYTTCTHYQYPPILNKSIVHACYFHYLNCHYVSMQEMSPVHRGLCWAFRDTMLLGYRAGYTTTEPVTLPENIRVCVDALTRMALLLTHSAVA